MAEEKDTIKADQQETADIPKDQENAAEAAETAQVAEQEPAEENAKEAEAAQPDTQEGEEKKEKFSKRKEKKEKRDKKDEKIEELSDQVKRQMAEFDNYRKRTEKEKSHMYEIGAKEVIEDVYKRQTLPRESRPRR